MDQSPVTQNASTRPSAQPQDDTSVNVVQDTPSPVDAKTSADKEKSNSETDTEIPNVGEEQGDDVSNTIALKERIVEIDEGQVRSDPGKTPESRTPPEQELMEEDQAGSNPGQMHESFKLTMEEHVHIENPPSSSGTLSSMKNLDDAFTFCDQFLNDKPTEEEPSTTATTTTLPLPPPPPQQSTTVPEITTYVFALEKICANFKKKNKLRDKTTQALSSRVYTLKNHDLYSKIDKYVNEVIKEVAHNALQALIYERFRDLSEFEMKEILCDRMFESGSYRSHLEHSTLYKALEESMDRENRE
ncbi:hypothetical protein Tco_1387915 [Tanacetum coccineum]